MLNSTPLQHVEAGVLNVAYRDSGASDGKPVVLLHGFPYDIHAYDEVTSLLVAAGCRVITPYLRGFGGTRFLKPETLRSGQQAALAHDVLALMDALGIPSAVLAGFDWGGRAACIVAALWPERVQGLVSDGYSIQQIATSAEPQPPDVECRYWYQFYFHGERGRAGLTTYRRELCKRLWEVWSPQWQFDAATFDCTAMAFDNPDFVEVVIHSYRHRFGLVPGDPTLEATEARLASLPPISVPTITLHGAADTVTPPALSEHDQPFFTSTFESRIIPSAGHNLPQEAPHAFAEAVRALVRSS
ncbi:alpha/beta hydrolase [Lysobacter sp. CFH 32150]|uniref:alpha/beta fold hydrolase n=1 Tax=Lysobacter sp. CFH 32150 TaxID=2927128 RepID=UPI001FA7BB0B|nr:alpha/beta hydrolase [Lysobacter sp. CFH 32150]MCI4566641.1 alpha/beta hydrolase [Lysobacter sp. CFH 32150]